MLTFMKVSVAIVLSMKRAQDDAKWDVSGARKKDGIGLMAYGTEFFRAALMASFFVFAPSVQASVIDRVHLEARPAAKFQVVDSGSGFQTLLVVSNAAYDVSIEGVIGEVNVDIKSSGNFRGRSFGSGAQTPGVQADTVMVASAFETVIYKGDRATAARPGSLWDQAVQVTVTYDSMATPIISINARD